MWCLFAIHDLVKALCECHGFGDIGLGVPLGVVALDSQLRMGIRHAQYLDVLGRQMIIGRRGDNLAPVRHIDLHTQQRFGHLRQRRKPLVPSAIRTHKQTIAVLVLNVGLLGCSLAKAELRHKRRPNVRDVRIDEGHKRLRHNQRVVRVRVARFDVGNDPHFVARRVALGRAPVGQIPEAQYSSSNITQQRSDGIRQRQMAEGRRHRAVQLRRRTYAE